MQEDKNWILPIEISANRSFWDFLWLEIWKNHLNPSMGPNEGSLAMVFPLFNINSVIASGTLAMLANAAPHFSLPATA